jgi:hypothetical protein
MKSVDTIDVRIIISKFSILFRGFRVKVIKETKDSRWPKTNEDCFVHVILE